MYNLYCVLRYRGWGITPDQPPLAANIHISLPVGTRWAYSYLASVLTDRFASVLGVGTGGREMSKNVKILMAP